MADSHMSGPLKVTGASGRLDSVWFPAIMLVGDTTGADGGLESALDGGGNPNMLVDNIYPGLALATTDVFGGLWKPPVTMDATKAIAFYLQVQFSDDAEANDAAAFALTYTNFTLGTTAISALPAGTDGVSNADAVTCAGDEYDDIIQNIGPFTIAAGTFTAVGMLGWAFTTTLTGFTDNAEVLVHGVEIQFSRDYV